MAEPIRSSGRAPLPRKPRATPDPEYMRLRELHETVAEVPTSGRMKRTTASTPFGTLLPSYGRKKARRRSSRWTR